MTWSIRLKFLLVMCGLLTVCLSVYLFMAVAVFKSDKTQLVFDLNRSQVSNLTSELETQFGGVSDKLKLFALLPPDLQSRMAVDLFSEGSDIVSVSIYNTETHEPLRSFSHQKYLETYGLEKNYFTELVKQNSIPLNGILKTGQDLWNASGGEGPPLIGYGRLVVVQDSSGRPVAQWAVVGFVKLDRFLKSVSIVSLSQVYVANKRGEVLVHPRAEHLLKRPNVSADPIFTEAVAAKSRISLVTRDLQEGRVLAAYGKGFNDQIFVIAKANEQSVFRVVQDFTIRTFLFGLIILTLVVLAALMLSRSLTENIALLVERMALVSQGDLTSPVFLKSRDETVTLATTFNQMISDLKSSRDALETMNRELDDKVKERTAQLEEQNRKVKEVQETLIRTTRLASVGEIAGRTAHEVLNPLTILLTRLGLMQKRAISQDKEQLQLVDEMHQAWAKDFAAGGFTNLVQGWQATSQVLPGANLFQEDLSNIAHVSSELREHNKSLRDDLQFIKNEGERIGKIINAMRRLGHFHSSAAQHSMHSVVDDCCRIMSDLFAQKEIDVVQELKAHQDLCVVDRDEMVQAVTNLMRNSLHAIEAAQAQDAAHKRHLVIRSLVAGDTLVIELEDNGVGIPQENQARLFDSSFTTKSQDLGTGLGLGISRRFVRSQNGELEFVGSDPHRATVFRIRLPLALEDKKGAVA